VTHFLLSVHAADAAGPTMSDADRQRSSSEIAALDAELKSAGAWVASGRLSEPQAATVVESHKGRIRMTDGPFIEAKEQVAGFYIIEAPDQEAAVRWASKASAAVGRPIEVRAFAGIMVG